eukprot:jgi/Picre1/28968/NNA_004362.t1
MKRSSSTLCPCGIACVVDFLVLIRSIEFRYPDSVSVSKKIALFPCAETVAIHGVDGYSMGSILKDVHDGLVRLERRLKRLVLSACYNIDDEVCKAIKEAVPQVEELGLFECGEHLGRQGLEHLSCLVHLKTLDFGYVSGCFESKDIEGMVSKLKKLKVLNLSGTSYVDNSVLQACVDHLPVLEKLDISECQEITRDGFMVLRNFKMLKDLNLGWNARVTDDVLEYLQEHCIDWMYLFARGCRVRGYVMWRN